MTIHNGIACEEEEMKSRNLRGGKSFSAFLNLRVSKEYQKWAVHLAHGYQFNLSTRTDIVLTMGLNGAVYTLQKQTKSQCLFVC